MESYMTKYANGESVFVEISGSERMLGEVVGVAVIPQPIIGTTYIVKCCDSSLPSDEYPFECIAVQEIFLRTGLCIK